ncbi:uncharacterized protein LOC106161442 [Lingula anatina]|uniref:Uncharacterized protein LOC106161442 n=1 Tax=Lingula anatina TaxID=7574 RepID=A0A1S3I6H0_LINAN|nr:uncharacterized protein LOC106161442 [Lingula anatina]|eukprot:XP_013393852.1 uncharacterized protein LOC106161442 [Lingula anatina]
MTACCYTTVACLISLSLLASITADPDACFFVDLVSRCRTTVKQYNVTITSTINKCHQPIDVTVELQNDQPPFTWKHTFANDGETQRIGNYTEETYMQFQIDRYFWQDKPELRMAAWIIMSKEGVNRFLKTSTMVSTEDCHGGTTNPVAAALAGIFVTVTVISLGVAVGFVCYKRRKHSKRREQLILNMEAPAVAEPFADAGQSSANRRHHQDKKDAPQVPGGSSDKIKEKVSVAQKTTVDGAVSSTALQPREADVKFQSESVQDSINAKLPSGGQGPLDLEGAVGYSLNPSHSGKVPFTPFDTGGGSRKQKHRSKQSHRGDGLYGGDIYSCQYGSQLRNSGGLDNNQFDHSVHSGRGRRGKRKKGGQRFSNPPRQGVSIHQDGGEKFAEELSVRLSSLQNEEFKSRQTNGLYPGPEEPGSLEDHPSLGDDHILIASLHRDPAGLAVSDSTRQAADTTNGARTDRAASGHSFSYLEPAEVAPSSVTVMDNPNGYGGAKPKRKLPQMQPVV